MAFCVGRSVATNSVTAVARPRRAMESACPVAAVDSSATSAYSSMTTISAGAAGLGAQSRAPSVARRGARISRIGDGVAEEPDGVVGGGGELVQA